MYLLKGLPPSRKREHQRVSYLVCRGLKVLIIPAIASYLIGKSSTVNAFQLVRLFRIACMLMPMIVELVG